MIMFKYYKMNEVLHAFMALLGTIILEISVRFCGTHNIALSVKQGESYSSRAWVAAELSQKRATRLFIFPGELRPGFGPFGVPGCRVLWPPAALEEG